jgi:hypothetical protein
MYRGFEGRPSSRPKDFVGASCRWVNQRLQAEQNLSDGENRLLPKLTARYRIRRLLRVVPEVIQTNKMRHRARSPGLENSRMPCCKTPSRSAAKACHNP